MKLTSEEFGSRTKLQDFVEKNNIVQGNIQSITSTGYFGSYVMFYWREVIDLENNGTGS